MPPTLYVATDEAGRGRAALYRDGRLAEALETDFGPSGEDYGGRPLYPGWEVHALLRRLVPEGPAVTRVRFAPDVPLGGPARFPAEGQGWPEEESGVPAECFPDTGRHSATISPDQRGNQEERQC